MKTDKAIGFHVTVGDNKYELVENYFGWSVYENDVEVYEGGRDSYRRALQVVVNRIGFGDID